MTLDEAWSVLGFDLDRVLLTIKRSGGPENRIAAAEKALEKARVVAKKLRASFHPDKNQGDNKYVRKFIEIGEALEVIEHHTKEIKEKFLEMKKSVENPPINFISIIRSK